MTTPHWLLTALCLFLAVAPAALAQEADETLEMPAEAPQVSPAELKKQLQNLKSAGSGMAGVQDLARIARSIKASGGKMTLQDVQTLRTTLKQTRDAGATSQNPLYADMLDQLDGALARLERQIANPDGWEDEAMPTE